MKNQNLFRIRLMSALPFIALASLSVCRAQDVDMTKIQAGADKGDAEAEFQLGRAYANGQGEKQDFKKAAEWYRKSADQGNAKAQNNLALLYDRGQGVAKDDAEAAKWFRKSAEQGAAFAEDSLATMLMQGRGAARNSKEAAQWFQKAAEQGDADSQFKLGQLYFNGDKDVKQDYKEAAKWFTKAAEQDSAMAQASLGSMYFYGFGVQKDMVTAYQWLFLASTRSGTAKRTMDLMTAGMTPEEIAKGKKMADAFRAAHSTEGSMQ